MTLQRTVGLIVVATAALLTPGCAATQARMEGLDPGTPVQIASDIVFTNDQCPYIYQPLAFEQFRQHPCTPGIILAPEDSRGFPVSRFEAQVPRQGTVALGLPLPPARVTVLVAGPEETCDMVRDRVAGRTGMPTKRCERAPVRVAPR